MKRCVFNRQRTGKDDIARQQGVSVPEVLLEEIVADVGEKIGDKLDEVTEERPWVRVLIRNLMYLVALAIAVYAINDAYF